MNNIRRKEINKVIEEIYNLQSRVEELLGEEEEYRDNIPENLQNSDRYYQAEENIDNLQTAYDTFDDIVNSLECAME